MFAIKKNIPQRRRVIDTNENMQQLRAMMETFATWESTKLPSGNINLKVEEGEIVCEGNFKNIDLALSTCVIGAGSKLKEHAHSEMEWFGVIEGSIRVSLSGNQTNWKYLYKGDCLYIPPMTLHRVEALKYDTTLWALTIPAAKEFPEGA